MNNCTCDGHGNFDAHRVSSTGGDVPFSRRLFIQQGLTLASLAFTTPLFIERSARAMMLPIGSSVSSQPGVPDDRILVVVQLGGGNDGLNTVIPFGASEYYRARRTIAVPEPGRGDAGALLLDDRAGLGLHPRFAQFKELIDDGLASIIQGVGYPNPNRSHFTAMDIWHTANTSATGNGWLGRYFDNTCNGTPEPDAGVAIGRSAPLAMIGKLQKPVSFESADLFKWAGEELHPAMKEPYEKINRTDPANHQADTQLNFLTRTALDAQMSSERIRAAVAQRPLVNYPGGNLSRQLRIVGAMIRAGMKTRVYYVSLGGFDTHANQPGQHANLLAQLGGSLNAFQKDLKAQGNAGRVLTLVFSEFGRRVSQNASNGTDHGAAAPMFLMGEMVRPGVLGNHPSLTDLDQGDLKYNADFRCVYAAILEDWMKADARAVLGGQFQKARVLKT